MSHYGWSVIGAGPAGIAAIGKLLDAKVPPHSIAWIDPSFTVGDLGEKWYRVPGNTKVKTFVDFLKACQSFNYGIMPDFDINNFDQEKTCRLGHIADPLKWVSDHLQKRVTPLYDKVNALSLKDRHWHIELNDSTIVSKQVILATGCHPKKLAHPIKEIPIEVALNDQLLSKESLENETIGVFGASHTAIVVLENLLNCKTKKVINFYRQPLKYAVHLDDFILFDNTGLKGNAAEWAKKHIDGSWPEHLERVHCDSDTMHEKLEQCTRIIYAIGFEKNASITFRSYSESLSSNDFNGIIAPGLFGLGIAYPNQVADPYGNIEHNVGLLKFMKHLTHCLPLWMHYHA